MSSVINSFNDQVDNIPFFGMVSGLFEDKVGEKYQTKDPFYEKIPKKDPKQLKKGEKMEYKEVRRRPPPNITPEQRKLWKKVMKRAWYHDRNFCGCMPINLGLGMITIVSIFPVIGSAIAYKMHYKLIKSCHQAGVPAKIKAEMVGNIGVDFLKSLIPLLGILLSWIQASSTANAALFDTWLRRESMKKEQTKQEQADQQLANQQQLQPLEPAMQKNAPRKLETDPRRQQSQNQSVHQSVHQNAPTSAAHAQSVPHNAHPQGVPRSAHNAHPQGVPMNAHSAPQGIPTQGTPPSQSVTTQSMPAHVPENTGYNVEGTYPENTQYGHPQPTANPWAYALPQEHPAEQSHTPPYYGTPSASPKPSNKSPTRKPVPKTSDYDADEVNFRIPPAGTGIDPQSISKTRPHRKPVGSG